MNMKAYLCVATMIVTSGLSSVASASSQPFIGEIDTFGYKSCPEGWAEAKGQLLAVTRYSALFGVFGNRYGGNGVSSFRLPNLKSVATIPEGAESGGAGKAQAKGGPPLIQCIALRGMSPILPNESRNGNSGTQIPGGWNISTGDKE